jgi:hypothetical protein
LEVEGVDKPFRIGKFELGPTGFRAIGKPDYMEWAGLGAFLQKCEESIAWWVGGWVIYGEQNFEEKMAQAVKATGLKVKTIQQYAWVYGNVPVEVRNPALEFSHHRAVAALPVKEQRSWLKRAEREVMPVHVLVKAIAVDQKKAKQEFWLKVECTSERDRERLMSRMRKESRTVKIA